MTHDEWKSALAQTAAGIGIVLALLLAGCALMIGGWR